MKIFVLVLKKCFAFLKMKVFDHKSDSHSRKILSFTSSGNPLHFSNVLIIDDDMSCLSTLELLLKKENYNVAKADNGMVALQYLTDNPQSIDFILLDLMMPGVSGFEILNILEKNDTLKNIPIIIQSGIIDEEILVNISNRSVKGFVTKPYKKQELIDAIDSLQSS